MMQNNLFIRRLIVKTNEGLTAYDEAFHEGVNIISGQNSSGKSTIIRFIFFVLGGCYSDFVPEAMKCRLVVAEVEINGNIYTLKRHLEKADDGKVNKYAPMYIYFGSIQDYLADHRQKNEKWQKYGYKTTNEQRSFSNVLFELMGLPEFRADSNITMYQILRLIYLDQESPLSSIFFYDPWDKELYRETVSRLLMGLYDDGLSNAKLEKIAVEKEMEEVNASIKVAKEILKNPETMSSAFLSSMIDNLAKEVEAIIGQVQQLRSQDAEATPSGSKNTPAKAILKWEYQQLQSDIARQRNTCGKLEDAVQQLKAEIQDSTYFIEALKKKQDALDHSMTSRAYFDTLPMELCPVCLSPLHGPAEVGHCPVCQSPIDDSRGKTQAVRIRLELEHQIRESETLLKGNQTLLDDKRFQLRTAKRQLRALQSRYETAVNNVRSAREEYIDHLLQDKGYKEAEANQYRTLLEYAERYEELKQKLADLEQRNDALVRYINAAEAQVEKNEATIVKAISANGIFMLKNDEDRQTEFMTASDFKVNYKQNQAFISNQHIKLSASSSFYLKMAARFAMFFASLQIDTMKYPRLMFSDNMEDKGMEEERAKNFQRTIVQRLKEIEEQNNNFSTSNSQLSTDSKPSTLNYQLIFATSNIAEELDKPEYTIGEYYTQTNKSLKNV